MDTYTRKEAERDAARSLYMGVLGLFFGPLLLIFPGLALHYGTRARRARDELSPGRLRMAKIGTGLGWVGFVVGVISVLALVVLAGKN